ncbi:MAG: gliding motility protein [Deltaproteobacteria bacterium]|nr:gliding motility protein [Deltaproteobacteria bacterium]
MRCSANNASVTLRFAYCGAAGVGKTSNLAGLHARSVHTSRSHLARLASRSDRTAIFDLRLEIPHAPSALSIELCCVSGEAKDPSTHRWLLRNADVIVFVADSRIAAAQSNADAFLALKTHLRSVGMDPRQVPMVIQFNRQDEPKIRSSTELLHLASAGRERVFLASAAQGRGIVETFVGAMDVLLTSVANERSGPEVLRSHAAQIRAQTAALMTSPD